MHQAYYEDRILEAARKIRFRTKFRSVTLTSTMDYTWHANSGNAIEFSVVYEAKEIGGKIAS